MSNRRMIWAESETVTGWCCSHCAWSIATPRLETTVAAISFNRVAQETFERHDCASDFSAD
jgi:hypothetical protein